MRITKLHLHWFAHVRVELEERMHAESPDAAEFKFTWACACSCNVDLETTYAAPDIN